MEIENKADDTHDVIYALRTLHQHQTQLLVLADQKAHILTGILTVVLMIVFSQAKVVLEQLDQSLILLFSVFLGVELMALIFALMVVMPNLSKLKSYGSMDKVPNPFFFGFFIQFPEDDYVSFVNKNINTSEDARQYMSKDIYQTGQVLDKKYRMLRSAYTFAIIGVVTLVASFIVLRMLPALG